MSDRELAKQKRDTLIEMTDEFADQYLNEEYKMLCRKLIKKMSRKRQVPFLTGRMDIWAASVVYALGHINFLFDKKSEPFVSPDDLCDYFGVKRSTTSQKAKKIRDMFKMWYFDEEFSTQRLKEENPMRDIVLIEGIPVPIPGLRTALERELLKLKEEPDLEEKTTRSEEDSKTGED